MSRGRKAVVAATVLQDSAGFHQTKSRPLADGFGRERVAISATFEMGLTHGWVVVQFDVAAGLPRHRTLR